MVLNLGFQTNSWKISIRQLAYTLVTLFASIPITYDSNRTEYEYQGLMMYQAVCYLAKGSQEPDPYMLRALPRRVSRSTALPDRS